jgi:hypothetical protein
MFPIGNGSLDAKILNGITNGITNGDTDNQD